MQLAHAPGAITFAVCISPHINKAEPGPNCKVQVRDANMIKQ